MLKSTWNELLSHSFNTFRKALHKEKFLQQNMMSVFNFFVPSLAEWQVLKHWGQWKMTTKHYRHNKAVAYNSMQPPQCCSTLRNRELQRSLQLISQKNSSKAIPGDSGMKMTHSVQLLLYNQSPLRSHSCSLPGDFVRRTKQNDQNNCFLCWLTAVLEGKKFLKIFSTAWIEKKVHTMALDSKLSHLYAVHWKHLQQTNLKKLIAEFEIMSREATQWLKERQDWNRNCTAPERCGTLQKYVVKYLHYKHLHPTESVLMASG